MKTNPHIESKRVIYETQDYDAFRFLDANRPIRESHVEDIKRSILNYGNLLHLYPVVVKRLSERSFEIHDGQHRFCAARALRIPFFYLIDEDGVLTLKTLQATNTAQQKWSYTDYLHSFCEQKFVPYLALRAFLEEYPFPLMSAIRMLHSQGGDRRYRLDFKVGLFRMHNEAFVRFVASLCARMRSALGSTAFHADFIGAVAMIARNPELDPDRLVSKVEYTAASFENRSGVEVYFDQLCASYNWKAREENIVLFDRIDALGRVQRAGRWITDEEALRRAEEANNRIAAEQQYMKTLRIENEPV